MAREISFTSYGVHYEKMEEFEKSCFSNVYRMAFQQLDDIIVNGQNEEREQRYGRSLDRYEEYTNVISFIGGRGTGKTSAMLSFMESLKDYYRISHTIPNDKLFYKFKRDSERDISFTCLDCIDGSLLEKGEDIFKIVLAQMYEKFHKLEENHDLLPGDERGEYGYQKRELLKKFDKLYGTICELDRLSTGRDIGGESYMNNLQALSSSQKIKKEFANLTKEYLAILKYKHNNYVEIGNPNYLVVTVDDIDLNIQNGFNMLERIHRYLMIPNIIVLLSVDYKQLVNICRRYFSDVLPKVDFVLTGEMPNIRRIAIDYLDKVLPLNCRVYLPDISERYTSYIIKGDDFKVKQNLLTTYYKKSGVAFDAMGLKRHFLEPESMRILEGTIKNLKLLDTLPVEQIYKGQIGDKTKETLEKNYEYLCLELHMRRAVERLDIKEMRDVFSQVMDTDVRRSIQSVVDFSAVKQKKETKDIYSTDYYYGDLLNALYDLGRVENGKYKPLVQCLLAHYSYELTREYYNDKLGINENPSMPEVTSGTLAGKWIDQMIPPILFKEINELSEETDGKKEVPKKKHFTQVQRKSLMTLLKMDIDKNVIADKNVQGLKDYIIDVEIMFMSIHMTQYSAGKLGKWVVETDEVSNKEYLDQYTAFNIRGETKDGKKIAHAGKFDVFAFIKNSISGTEELLRIEIALREKLKELSGCDLDEKSLLAAQYLSWKKVYGDDVAFPVYWFDMSYNVLKRTKRILNKSNPEGIGKEDTFLYIRKMYQEIARQLKLQREFYDKAFPEEEQNMTDYTYRKFDEKFEKCPYVSYFLEEDRLEEKKSRFSSLVDKIFLGNSDE